MLSAWQTADAQDTSGPCRLPLLTKEGAKREGAELNGTNLLALMGGGVPSVLSPGMPEVWRQLRAKGGLGSPRKQPRVRFPRVQISPSLQLRGSHSRRSELTQVQR